MQTDAAHFDTVAPHLREVQIDAIVIIENQTSGHARVPIQESQERAAFSISKQIYALGIASIAGTVGRI